MSKTLTGGAAAALLLSGLLIAGAPAQVAGRAQTGAKYDFTTLLDSRKDGVRATRCPAINSLGTVAVTGQDLESGVTRIVTKRSPADDLVVVADTAALAAFRRSATTDSPAFRRTHPSTTPVKSRFRERR